eukprot:13119302-Heterocapsa_arctica.AAC.1
MRRKEQQIPGTPSQEGARRKWRSAGRRLSGHRRYGQTSAWRSRRATSRRKRWSGSSGSGRRPATGSTPEPP